MINNAVKAYCHTCILNTSHDENSIKNSLAEDCALMLEVRKQSIT